MSAPGLALDDHRRGRIIVHAAAPPPPGEPSAPTEPAPLLAVGGLCGGAGATTLAYLLARAAVCTAVGHVLVADTGGPSGGLAACAGRDAGRTLAEAGELLTHGLPLAPPLYATAATLGRDAHELRILATGPRLTSAGGPLTIAALLTAARERAAHALVIVDCGTLQRSADRLIAARATHIAWVLPATEHAASRAALVLDAMPPTRRARELVVARRDPTRPAPPQRTLAALAERRHAALVLLPHLDAITTRPEPALATAAVSLQAILGVMSR